MGISQHTTGTDNARCLIALCSITGQVGRPGTGLHPLRGQNNVQGASDAGLIPMMYPDYEPVDKPGARERFEQAWGRELDPDKGLTVTEIVASALQGGVRGMYMMGENPFLSDPNINKVRKALSALDFLVVQDIFLTETAEFADVILPATSYLEKEGTYTNTDRRVQIGRKVLDPPGEARTDWHIIRDISNRIGLEMDYGSASEIFDELVSMMPNYAGLAYDNLGPMGKLYPNADPEHEDGTVVLFDERFNTSDGKAHLVPAEWLPARELPDEEFPFVLNTGRLLEHWHTGSMTRRSYALDAIQPDAHVYLNPDDAAAMGIATGDFVRVTSRRGFIELEARLSHRDTPGTCFVPFHFREAAANLLTIDEVDPDGQDPRVQVLRGADRAGGRRRGARARDLEGGSVMPAQENGRAAERVGMRVQSRPPGTEARAGKFPGPSLIPVLTAIQREHGWLPREELVKLSQEARRPLYEIEGLISFYPHFRTATAGEGAARRCATTCRAGCTARTSGSPSSSSATATTSTSSCTRSRASGAATSRPRSPSTSAPRRLREADALIDAARGGEPPAAKAKRSDRTWPNDPYEPGGERYRQVRRMLAGELDHDAVIAAVTDSGLRGMGGAGFPTGRKWQLVADQEATPKYAICNADESEPGTFKDRQIMAEQPHLVIEGLMMGMLVTGVEEGWIFIRHEYGPEEEVLRAELEALERDGLLGADAGGSGPAAADRDLHLARRLHPRRGVGADRVHGGPPRRAAQQAALPRHLRALGPADADELRRDLRPRPDHRRARCRLVEGAGGQRRHRAEVLRGLGPRRAPRRLLRPDGHDGARADRPRRRRARRRGAAVLPARRRLVELPRARTPSTSRSTSQPLAEAGSMLGSGAVTVVAEGTNLLAAGTNVLRFFRNESCGKCVPCRVGSQQGARDPHRDPRAGPRRGCGRRAHHRARGDASADLDLRAGPGRARSRDQRPGSRARRHGRPPAAALGRRRIPGGEEQRWAC